MSSKAKMTPEKACIILKINISDKNNHKQIKSSFATWIRQSGKDRQARSELNLAYECLIQEIYPSQCLPQEVQIIEAIFKGNFDFIKEKIRTAPWVLRFKQKGTQYDLLYMAVRSGHQDIVELLLQTGWSLNYKNGKSTPLHCAAFYHYQHLIPLLLKYGIPTNVKNHFDSLAEEQTSKKQIKNLLDDCQKDKIYELISKLFDAGLIASVLNLSLGDNKSTVDVKKLILKCYFHDFDDFVDGFHGTDFDKLLSIADLGLRMPGDKINDSSIEIVPGHIKLGSNVNNVQNWAKAIFISPSVLYSGKSVYSKTVIIDNVAWRPILQVKVKKGAYSQHEHTLLSYNHCQNEPKNVQYRIPINDQQNSKYNKNHDQKFVKVVAIMLIREKFFEENIKNYKKLTNFIMNSENQIIFRDKNRYLFPKTDLMTFI